MKRRSGDDPSRRCARCGSTAALPWRCKSCSQAGAPARFCSMACVWAHGPDVHLESRAYQIDADGTPGPVPRRLMVVDDDLEVLAAMSELLREEGYEVTTFTRGPDALAAHPERYDAVIVDLRMPVMSGEDFKRALDARGAAVPVILMSSDDRVSEYASSLGCFDSLHKSGDFDAVPSIIVRAVAEKDALSRPLVASPPRVGEEADD